MPPPTPGLPHAPAVYLLQALLSLALVVALIYGAYWLLRRSGMSRPTGSVRGPAEVVQSLPLHGAYVLHIVKVAGKLWAVTCGPGGVVMQDFGVASETLAPRGVASETLAPRESEEN